MGTSAASELDAWLSAGGLVVASSDRSARAVLRQYHVARQREGRIAWSAPRVLSWQAFLRVAWEERAADSRLVLSPQQELSQWERIMDASGLPSAVLDAPRRRVAAMAMQAHALVCAYAAKYLDPRKRSAWTDGETWSSWLEDFDARCRETNTVSADRLALELVPLLRTGETRPALLLTGFDRLTPAQRSLLDAWGLWRHIGPADPAKNLAMYEAPDTRAELAACAAWCRQKLDPAPESRVLVIAQSVAERRGELERAFLRENERGAALRFEFSLGVPLASIGAPRSAEMLLRWLDGTIEEQELDWLIASGHIASVEQETAQLAAAMRTLRRHNRQRTHWTLPSFLRHAAPLPRAWVARITAAQDRLRAGAHRERSPLEWAEAASHLLETAGWPGARAASSADFQAARRWSQMLESCGSLGFDGRRTSWSEFLRELRAAMAETLFAPESEDSPIVIAGPAESAGLEADAIWFLGADVNAWPARADLHPLLPASVQRETGMPHATAALDWELAQAITERVLRSAPEVRFSYAAQTDGTEARPSQLAMHAAGEPQPTPHELVAPHAAEPLVILYEDASRIAFAPDDGNAAVHGGAAVIAAQSHCPFQAFATARLGAEAWDVAAFGLSPKDRGELVHAVLHAVWGGAETGGLRTLADLKVVVDLTAFVRQHVRRVLDQKIPLRVREQMPAAYIALEENRLNRLIAAWLEYERTRAEFAVEATELRKPVAIAGLQLNLRLDRLDRLNDGSFLVIDYKTGNVSDRAWDLPRPQDPQLPVYAVFGRGQDQTLGGLVFAKIRAGDIAFAGRVGDALGTLLPNLGRASTLVRRPFQAEQLDAWREEIEQLARDFLAGRADVDPRDEKTCESCDLHALCRIQEREPEFAEEAEEEDADA